MHVTLCWDISSSNPQWYGCITGKGQPNPSFLCRKKKLNCFHALRVTNKAMMEYGSRKKNMADLDECGTKIVNSNPTHYFQHKNITMQIIELHLDPTGSMSDVCKDAISEPILQTRTCDSSLKPIQSGRFWVRSG